MNNRTCLMPKPGVLLDYLCGGVVHEHWCVCVCVCVCLCVRESAYTLNANVGGLHGGWV